MAARLRPQLGNARNIKVQHYATKGLPEVYQWSKKRPTTSGVSLKTLMTFGSSGDPNRMAKSAEWLRNELPIRLANQVVCLDKLPYGLCMMPSIRRVRDCMINSEQVARYITSFEEMSRLSRVTSEEDTERFTNTLQVIYERHSPMMITMARGVFELKKELGRLNKTGSISDISDYVEIHQYLDKFYLARIGIRILIGQHIELVKQRTEPRENYVGLICRTTSPKEVAAHAIEDARYICERTHGEAPEINIKGTDLNFPYIPSHLYYMLFELLKNSLRATIETHKGKSNKPPINIIIADSDKNEDVSIKISDEGGGIPRSVMPKLFSYMYSTAVSDELLLSSSISDFDKSAPLAGLGVGLPLSRLYARYFGGDLQLMSMEAYDSLLEPGTDAYLHVARLGDKEELLPAPFFI